jgi:hypothetical protein
MRHPPARMAAQRMRDTLHRLEHDVDAWVSTAGVAGVPCLVPLCFWWDGKSLLIATRSTNPTSRNLLTTGRARVAIGPTRDVVVIEANSRAVPAAELPAKIGDAYAAKTGWDPRRLPAAHIYFFLAPYLIQAWREINELEGRDLMRDGRWLLSA